MFGIPEIEKKTFRNDFLNRVVVAGAYNNNRSCTVNRQMLKDRYAEMLPMQSDNPQQQYQINFDVRTKQTSVNANVDEQDHQVTLRSKNMQKELTMMNNSFRYQEVGDSYGTSVTFDNTVLPAIDYLKTSGVAQLNMMKLQKINVIGYEIGKQEGAVAPVPFWQPASSLINARLVPQYDAMIGVVGNTRQHISNLQLTDGAYLLTIKYGFRLIEKKNDGSIAKGQVIVDLEIERKMPVFIDAVEEELRQMHKELYNAFLWSISDSYVKLLDQGEEVQV